VLAGLANGKPTVVKRWVLDLAETYPT